MSLCGGQHRSKVWTKEQIREHMKNPCIDCYCGINFKTKERKCLDE